MVGFFLILAGLQEQNFFLIAAGVYYIVEDW